MSSPTAASAYAGHWWEGVTLSVRFDCREDWCRASSAEARLWATNGPPADPNRARGSAGSACLCGRPAPTGCGNSRGNFALATGWE
jgi:hypothetical protein